MWRGDIRGGWPSGAIVTENGEPHVADNGAGSTRKGSPEMFQLRWTEPGGPQTAYLAPAAAALDMYVNLLCNGYTVECEIAVALSLLRAIWYSSPLTPRRFLESVSALSNEGDLAGQQPLRTRTTTRTNDSGIRW